MEISKDFRSGYAALIGRPNSGKSTLLNQFLKFKLSIVTRKPQTTRKKVLGILTEDKYQIVFIDTPGVIEPRYNLQTHMMKYLGSALEDADIIVYLSDVSRPGSDPEILREKILPQNKPVIVALNKIDLVNKDEILPLIEKYRSHLHTEAIIPISAMNNDGTDLLLREIVNRLPYNPPYYPPGYVTDQQERFFVSEIIREEIFDRYGQEIPYSCHVQIEEFREREKGKDYIRAVIFADHISQKGILIGKNGQALKRVGEGARRKIEGFLERPVFLELYVKVMENWRKKERNLKDLGY